MPAKRPNHFRIEEVHLTSAGPRPSGAPVRLRVDRLARGKQICERVRLPEQLAVGFDIQEYVRRLSAICHEHRLLKRDALRLTDVLVEFPAAEAFHVRCPIPDPAAGLLLRCGAPTIEIRNAIVRRPCSRAASTWMCGSLCRCGADRASGTFRLPPAQRRASSLRKSPWQAVPSPVAARGPA